MLQAWAPQSSLGCRERQLPRGLAENPSPAPEGRLWGFMHFTEAKGPQQQEAFPVVSLRSEGPKLEKQSRTFTSLLHSSWA